MKYIILLALTIINLSTSAQIRKRAEIYSDSKKSANLTESKINHNKGMVVIAIENGHLYVDKPTEMINRGDILEVYEESQTFIHPVTGEIIVKETEPLAQLTVYKIFEKYVECEINQSNAISNIKPGMAVRISSFTKNYDSPNLETSKAGQLNSIHSGSLNKRIATNNVLTLLKGSPIVLSVNEHFDSSNSNNYGTISAIVENDIYASDSPHVVIQAGTPVSITYSTESNGGWGKAGRICITGATTRTIDKKQVTLNLNSCKKGSSRVGGVVALSVIFFPSGLFSGFMKGTMPKISRGTKFHATTNQDIEITL